VLQNSSDSLCFVFIWNTSTGRAHRWKCKFLDFSKTRLIWQLLS
jgi:hypothetical protein